MNASVGTVVIGAGQAGLAMSRCLSDRGLPHVVLERGAVANSWDTQRWESFRLLSPNWQTRLPGHRYTGPDPHGFMTGAEVVEFLQGYARSFGAPVHTGVEVLRVRSVDVVCCHRRGVRRPGPAIAVGRRPNVAGRPLRCSRLTV